MTGGKFLVEEVSADQIFIPEEFGENERAMAEVARGFVEREVVPRTEAIEAAEGALMPELMKRAGELGLLMLEVPEEHGGLGLGEKISTWISEIIAEGNASFAITLTGHMGIGTLPVLYSGNPGAKKQYISSLISGEKIGCFALTEHQYGSDALSAKTTATPSADGRGYVITGTKQFTTNAGFSGLYTVLAQVPGKGLTVFLLEGSYPGVSTGKEEKKMGLKGSSTRSLILDQVGVPAENVLGEVGKGHVVVLNALNLGRIKVGACCTGSARTLIRESLSYAQERRQFGKPIASFGLIQQKLARMAIQLFAVESILYRTAGVVEEGVSRLGKGNSYDTRVLQAIGEFAAECAMVKVKTSETLDFIVDEAVQIFGGYGFIEDYPVARAYRDARVSRIFEGTNEINRLTIMDWLYRLDHKGQLPLTMKAKGVSERGISSDPRGEIWSAKNVFLALWALLQERYGEDLQGEQELLAMLADLAIEIYAAESADLRSRKIASRSAGETASLAGLLACLCRLHLAEAVRSMVPRFLAALMQNEDSFSKLLAFFEKSCSPSSANAVRLEREVASRLLKAGHYPFPAF